MLVLRTLLAAVALLAASCGRGERPGVQPEHLFLITVEGLRADHVHALGYHRPTTTFVRADGAPALDLDTIAEGGVTFSGALAASGDARASLATIHTGVSPLVHGVLTGGAAIPDALPTLAEDLAAAGFRTAAFVCAGDPLEGTGIARGFEVARFVQDDHQALQAFAQDLNDAAGDDRPRFWWLHLSGPRHPWSPAPIATGPDFRVDHLAGRDPGRVREDAAFFDELRAGAFVPDDAERAALIALYDAELERVDFLMRRGFEALATRGGSPSLMDRTAILVVGASGVELGERPGAWRDDAGVFEESLRVPIVLRHPFSVTGRRILGGVVEHADVAPTARELMGVRAPEGDERSLLARTDSWRPRAFPERPALALVATEEGGLSVGARVGGDRLVLPYLGTVALYDLQHDPSQRNDLSAAWPDRTRAAAQATFDALFALQPHPDLDGDGREYLLRILHAEAQREATDRW